MSAALATFPGPAADIALLPAWQARVTNDDRRGAVPALRVGLVRTEGSWPWRDDPRLASLIDAVSGVAFRSLRYRDLVWQEGTVPVRLPDLVIALDAATADLAASLGCTAWLLLSCDRGRCAMPRHDGVRVFSQPRPFDWQAPLARMAAELAAMALPWTQDDVEGEGEDLRSGLDWFSAR